MAYGRRGGCAARARAAPARGILAVLSRAAFRDRLSRSAQSERPMNRVGAPWHARRCEHELEGRRREATRGPLRARRERRGDSTWQFGLRRLLAVHFKTTQKYIDLAEVTFGDEVRRLSDWYAAAGTKKRYQIAALKAESGAASGLAA